MLEGELSEKSKTKSVEHLISTVISILASFVENHFEIDIEASTKQMVKDEAQLYFESGNCRTNHEVGVCINPTLLDPTSFEWKVHYLLSPFEGYLPLTKEQLYVKDTSVKSKIMTQSCQKILKSLLFSYRSRIENIKIFVHLEDALEFCYAGSAENFDVIDCSNLGDHLGLANILNACSRRLADHPAAMLFTESIVWTNLAVTAEKYVERALCCPLSMIPTVYGFRLAHPRVELGACTIDNLRRRIARPLIFCWQNAPRFRNISLSSSPALSRFLDKLADVCFDTAFPRDLFGSQPGDGCGSICYTPFSYNFIVDAMIQRVGGDSWFKNHRQLGIHRSFDLTKRTAEAWRDGQSILKISAETHTTEEQIEDLIDALSEVPPVRLVLVPCPFFEKSQKLMNENKKCDLSGPDIHFFDNFELEMNRSPDGNSTIIVSFLLVSDHGLEETHLAFLMDLVVGMTTFTFKPIKTMLTEKFTLPHPFFSEKSKFSISEESQMMVDSCVECEEQYILKISILRCDDEVSGESFYLNYTLCLKYYCKPSVLGLIISTDQRKPCESAHEITLSFRQPNYIKPLLLSFPYPFLVDNIKVSLHCEDRFISLVLKKAILEPWPCEFKNNSKWKPDSLQPWEEKKDLLGSTVSHLGQQFNFYHLQNRSLMENTALNELRGNLSPLLSSSTDFYCIQLKGSKQNPDWFLRIHKPILTSPLNSPIVLLSAFYNQLTGKHKEKSDRHKTAKDFFCIFPDYKPEKTPIVTLEIDNKESLLLWRFILRLNSTKIEPSLWQKKYLPMGENSLCLSTFISPLYQDFFMCKKIVDERIPSLIRPTQNCCAACKQITRNLKRCSRCHSTTYCSVECQRQHWILHKLLCIKK